MNAYSKNEAAINSNERHNTRAVLGLAALGVVLAISAFIFSREVIISLKDFSIMKGILGSPWVGLENYQSLFENINFSRIIVNTLVYNLLFACLCFFISSTVGLAVNTLSKRSILRDVLAVLAILPVFIPDEIYSAWFMNLLGSQPFVKMETARFILPLIAALKYAGIPVFVTHILGILKRERDAVLPLKCAGLFSLASLSLIGAGNFSLVNQFLNPLIYESSDILDTYSYRTGFLQMQLGVNAAAGVLQCIICLVSMVLLFNPIKVLFKAAFNGEKDYSRHSLTHSLSSAVIAFVVFVLLYIFPYVAKGSLSGILPEDKLFIIPTTAIIIHTMVSLVAALLGTGIAFAASSFTDGGKAARKVGLILLVLITVLTVRPFTFNGYLLIRGMGMIDTFMAIIVASMFSAASVWAFAAMRSDGYTRSNRSLLFGILGVFLILSALVYSDGMPSLLYLNRNGLSPFLLYRQYISSMQTISDNARKMALTGTLGVSGLMMSLPALMAFLIAKVLLPAESMLAVIAGGRKH